MKDSPADDPTAREPHSNRPSPQADHATAHTPGKPAGSAASEHRLRRSAWHRKASKPVTIWMGALVLVSLFHWALPNYRWVLIHMFTLGALTNSIMLWSQHFTEKFLHQPLDESTRPWQLRRFAILNAGIVYTIIGQLLANTWSYAWILTALGATVVGGSLAFHAFYLGQQYRRANTNQRYAPSVLAYIASAACLPFGAFFGAVLASNAASQPGSEWHDRLRMAHLATNVLGFVGFAAVGTLMLLFPTIWRTKAATERPKIALLLMGAGLLDILGGTLGGAPKAAGIGLVIVLAGVGVAAFGWASSLRPVIADPRSRVTFAGLCVAMAPLWLLGSLGTLAVRSFQAPSISAITLPTMALVIGFAAQLLIGVMSYLLPSNIGGGPAATRTGLIIYDRAGIFRATMVNVGLLLWLATDHSWLRIATSILAMGSLATFLVLTPLAVRAQLGVIRKQREPLDLPTRPAWGQATAALAVLALLVAASGGLGGSGVRPPATSTGSSSALAAGATGKTTEVEVSMEGMRFEPSTIHVPRGNNLRVILHNAGDQAHDLKFANGAESGRLSPGESVTMEVGAITEPLAGWCTIAGHRQQGMTIDVQPDGQASAQGAGSDVPGAANNAGDEHGAGQQAPQGKPVAADELHRDMVVDPALKPASENRVHKVVLDVSETELRLSDETTRGRWTFNGGPMGPVLRGKVGDRFEITLVNNGSMSHSVDFHAGMVSPDPVMRSIEPGETLQYNFTAKHAGAWLYHCGTAPMSLHLAAGMYGALIVDPPNLAPVDHEYILVQSEVYGTQSTADQPVDTAALAAGRPSAVVFNGIENQYVTKPLSMRVGETARFWLVNAGPNQALSFHIVGTQFHTTYKEGHYLLRESEGQGASQALDLLAAQGGFVEATFEEPGTYTMVNHQFIDAERGAKGQIKVTK